MSSNKKKTQARFLINLNFSKMSATNINTCSLCKKEHNKLFKPHEKVLGTQLANVIRTILKDEQLKFPQKFLICAECSMTIIQTQILFKRLTEALVRNKTKDENDTLKKSTAAKSVKSEPKIQEQKRVEENECDISTIDDKDVTTLDNTILEWTFNCAHCDFGTKEAKLYKNHLSAEHNLDNPRIYQCMHCPESYQRANGIQNHIAHVHENKPRQLRQRRKSITSDAPPLMSSTKIGEQFANNTKLGEQLKADTTRVNTTKGIKSTSDTKSGQKTETDIEIKAKKAAAAPKIEKQAKTDIAKKFKKAAVVPKSGKQSQTDVAAKISRIDENDKDVTTLDNTIVEWTFNCAHCDFGTKEAKLYRNHLSAKHNLDNPRIYQCMHCPESYQRANGIQNHIAHVHENKPRQPRQRRKTIALDDAPPLMSSTKIGDQFANNTKVGAQLKADTTLVNTTKGNKSTSDTKSGQTTKTDVEIKVKKAAAAPKLEKQAKTDIVKKVEKPSVVPKPGEQPKTEVAAKVKKASEDTKIKYEFKCEYCQYVTTFAKIFKNHLQKKHQVEETKIYKCKQCASSYVRQFALENHISYQHENKPRPPPQRRKSVPPDFGLSTTTDKDLLGLVGEIKHEGNETELTCEICSYESKNMKNLKKHMVIKHQIDRINQNGSLLIEDDEKDYDDEDAPQQKPHNERNLDALAKDWIFRCPYCTFESIKRKAYKTHIKSVHDLNDENIYKCIHCAGAYKRYNLLQSHVTNKHSIDLTELSDTSPMYIESSQEHKVNGPKAERKKKRKMEKQTINAVNREEEQLTKRPKIEDVAAKIKNKESCVVCGKQVSTIEKLRAHMDKKHPNLIS